MERRALHSQRITFGTSNPAYSRGQLVRLQGESRRAVAILGGVDRSRISGISGGWETTFNLESEGDVRISCTFRLNQSPHYESDEISQAIISVDGQETVLAELTGDGNSGPQMSTGIQPFSLDIHLEAGDHTLILGGFNNLKNARNEETFASFDDVTVATLAPASEPVTRDLIVKGINFGKITVAPDGTVDDSEIEGVNKDLRVRPFFAEGSTISIREFVVGALNAEMGLEAPDPDLVAASSGSLVVTTGWE